MSNTIRRFGLFGYPLAHSYSKKFFTEKFETENIDAHYNLYELKNISEFAALTEIPTLGGLNVTIPYKEQVIPLMDELDDTAAKIGAVNVIKFTRKDGKLRLKGYNSDAIGFENSIKSYLTPQHEKALILGTGGASKAINYTLQKLGIKTTFVSRTKKPDSFTYNELNAEIMAEYTVIINASPVGTFPHANECPDIPYNYLTSKHLLYDVVYNPPETVFLCNAKKQGAQGINGQEMLKGQAEAAWKIWNESLFMSDTK